MRGVRFNCEVDLHHCLSKINEKSQLSVRNFKLHRGFFKPWSPSVPTTESILCVYLQAAWEIEEKKPAADWPQEGKMKFENFSVRYREGLDLVLRGISCDIKGGEKVCRMLDVTFENNGGITHMCANNLKERVKEC